MIHISIPNIINEIKEEQDIAKEKLVVQECDKHLNEIYIEHELYMLKQKILSALNIHKDRISSYELTKIIDPDNYKISSWFMYDYMRQQIIKVLCELEDENIIEINRHCFIDDIFIKEKI